MKAPVSKKIPLEITQHGVTRIDNYAWLRDENWKNICDGDIEFKNPEILEYLNAENAYTQHMMGDTSEICEQLEAEFRSRLNEDKETYPFKRKDYLYYERFKKGLEYPIDCRRLDKEGAVEEIYFDRNIEASGKELYRLINEAVSPDNTFFAFAVNLSGSMNATIRVRNLQTKKDLAWEIPDTTGDILWLNDTNLLYVDREHDARGQRIYSINVVEGPSSRKLIFTKPEDYTDRFMWLQNTQDKQFIVVSLDADSSKTLFISSTSSLNFSHFVSGSNNELFQIEHINGLFYILTNDASSINGRVMLTSSEQAHWRRESWQEYIPQASEHFLSDISAFNDFLILGGRHNHQAVPVLLVHSINQNTTKKVELPEADCLHYIMGSDDHRDLNPIVYFESSIHPESRLQLNLPSATLSFLHAEKIPNFSPENYIVKKELVTARDGEKIPLTIIHKRDFRADGSAKALVYGYGSYGWAFMPQFKPHIFSLLDRGYCYCVAQVRGGSDKGHSWYLNGKMLNKKNTFFDFIDCCEFLIQKGYAHKDYLAIEGGSAGGLLVAAATNYRPDLFRAVLAHVPFVDVVNTISDDTLPLTPPEWEEWGNPIKSAEDFHYMMSYSPYENIQKTRYPAMLFDSGISDEQVTYWEPAKMVAKLREFKTDENMLLLNMRMTSGHAGTSKRYEKLKETAFDYSFLLKVMS